MMLQFPLTSYVQVQRASTGGDSVFVEEAELGSAIEGLEQLLSKMRDVRRRLEESGPPCPTCGKPWERFGRSGDVI